MDRSLSSLRSTDGKPIFVPIDGKTMRGSYTNVDKSDMLHIVSAWASQQGITLGQVAVDSQANEITAIPKLLEMLELTGTIVSIDWHLPQFGGVANARLLPRMSQAEAIMCCQ